MGLGDWEYGNGNVIQLLEAERAKVVVDSMKVE